MDKENTTENTGTLSEQEMAASLLADSVDENWGMVDPDATPTEESSTSEPEEVKAEDAATEEKVDDAVEESEESEEVKAAEEVEKVEAEEEPVVQAKDGKNIIPFSVLEETRSSEKAALQKIGELEAQLAQQKELEVKVEAAKASDEETGTNEAMDELLADLEEEHPEIVDGVKAIIKMDKADTKKAFEGLEQQITDLKEQLEPVKESAAKQDRKNHFDTILDVHEDLDEIMATKDEGPLREFLDKQPNLVRNLYEHTITNGTSAEVIELLDTFKDDLASSAVPEKEEPKEEVDKSDGKEAAKKALKKAKGDTTPTSLSEVPSGSTPPVDQAEALLVEKNPVSMMGKFAGKSAKEIENIISKVI